MITFIPEGHISAYIFMMIYRQNILNLVQLQAIFVPDA